MSIIREQLTRFAIAGGYCIALWRNGVLIHTASYQVVGTVWQGTATFRYAREGKGQVAPMCKIDPSNLPQYHRYIERLARAMGSLASTCCVCGGIYSTKSSQGATGGLSHGYCDECLASLYHPTIH